MRENMFNTHIEPQTMYDIVVHILTFTLERKRNLCRSRKRWKYNIKFDTIEAGWGVMACVQVE
jgi:hypothetical protein